MINFLKREKRKKMDYEEEWEFLPDSRFLDFPENPDEKKILSGKQRSLNPKSVFDMNYFMCPSPESKKIIETPSGNSSRKVTAKQLVPVPIQLEPAAILKEGHQDPEADDDDQVIVKKPTAITDKINGSNNNNNNNIGSIEADQDAVLSQVFFKKMKENEFVDMKILDSPKSPRNNIIPQIDAAATFNDQSSIDNMTCSPRKKKIEDQVSWNDEVLENDGLGLNLWKWSLTGIGAICSFGVAAATICVLIFGNQQKNKHHHQNQNQKLRFQIYADDQVDSKFAVILFVFSFSLICHGIFTT